MEGVSRLGFIHKAHAKSEGFTFVLAVLRDENTLQAYALRMQKIIVAAG
jgi:hypothetical protein